MKPYLLDKATIITETEVVSRTSKEIIQAGDTTCDNPPRTDDAVAD